MTTLSLNGKHEEFLHSMRPLLFGIPTFLVVFVFVLWALGRLASSILAILNVTK